MTRRIFLLNAIAILAVICNHTASWGNTAMFWWTDSYRQVAVPNFDQVGTLTYYVISVARKLAVFCVPAFFFVSGFFVAYASRGRQATLNWKMVKTRVKNLLVPYLIWSGVIFISDALQGTIYTPGEYLVRLLYLGAIGGYYFVPLLCQFYLLSPLVVPIAKTHWRWLLFVSALLHLSFISQMYLRLFGGAEAPALQVMRLLSPGWLFFRHAFIFALGMVSSLHLRKLKRWLARRKRGLLVAVVVLGALTILESEVVFRSTGMDWRDSAHTIVTAPYVLTFILSFLAFDKVSIPFSKTLHQLASRTYGIYLLHGKVMEFVARIIRQLAPWMLAHQLLSFLPVMFVFGLGVPLLIMASVARSAVRKSYPYLFG